MWKVRGEEGQVSSVVTNSIGEPRSVGIRARSPVAESWRIHGGLRVLYGGTDVFPNFNTRGH